PAHGPITSANCSRWDCPPADATRFLPWKPGFWHEKPGFQGRNRVSRDAGGSRTHVKQFCGLPPCRLATASPSVCHAFAAFNLLTESNRKRAAKACPPGCSKSEVKKCPRQELNLVYDLRRVACRHHTPRTVLERTEDRRQKTEIRRQSVL